MSKINIWLHLTSVYPNLSSNFLCCSCWKVTNKLVNNLEELGVAGFHLIWATKHNSLCFAFTERKKNSDGSLDFVGKYLSIWSAEKQIMRLRNWSQRKQIRAQNRLLVYPTRERHHRKRKFTYLPVNLMPNIGWKNRIVDHKKSTSKI